MSSKKYIISGPNGYLAGRLIKLLKQDPTVTIGAIGRSARLNEDIAGLVDFTIIYDKTHTSLIDDRILGSTAVFHLASLYTTKTDLESEIDLIESNILLSAHLIKAITVLDKQIPIVSASTFSAYSREHEYAPRNLYSATKVHAEEIAKTFGYKCGFITMSDTYGPGDKRPKIHNLLRDKKLTKINSPRTQKINYTHMDDVARAFVFLGDMLSKNTELSFEVYDILYPENEITLGELAELLDLKVEFGEAPEVEIPRQKRALPGFELRHNVKDIKSEIWRDCE